MDWPAAKLALAMNACQPSADSQPETYDNTFWLEGGANLDR